MEDSQLDRLVLDYVNQSSYQPVKPRVIAQQLRLKDQQQREVKRAVKRLVQRGQLEYGSNHLVRPIQTAAANRITGVFRRTQRGFGFVRPSGTSHDESNDIYIAEKKSRDASSGDLVLARLLRSSGPEHKTRGEIVEVLERAKHQFVGTYLETDGMGLVRIDGGIFGDAIYVGDAGAKNAQPGDKVVIEMVHFPSHVREGEGVIQEVLGSRGAPGVDTLTIIREYNLPDQFPEDVHEAARNQAERFNESIPKDRSDLTDLTVITIDPADARDFDDAISLERISRRHWRLGVHIADVAHFVRPKSPLDREARDRATSVYLPDRVIPMLPEVISNNLASLQPRRVRYTKSVFVEYTFEGARVHTDICSAAIRSKRRLTYEQVDDFLKHPVRWQKKLSAAVFQLLSDMHQLAMILRARRFQRGSLELSLAETKIDLDQHGRACGAHLVEHTESHQIIEEFMLAANEAVAELLKDRQIPFLRRIHESPEPRKLKQLTEFVQELEIKTESLQSRFELQRVLEHVKGLPQEKAVNYAVLRSMQKAVYSPQEEGHFALASDCYCHFTSPIRRYPDLTIHRLLDAIVRGRQPTQHADQLRIEGEHCSEREHRAEMAERNLVKLKLLQLLSQRIGQEMDAVITGVEEFGLFAQGSQLPAEGLIHIRSMKDDHYRFERASHSLNGARRGNSYRLGDLVRVEIKHVDLDARQLDYRLVGRLQQPAARSSPKSSRKKATRATGREEKTRRATGKRKTKATRKTKRKKTKSAKTGKKRPRRQK